MRKCSIIIASYNEAGNLKKCLDSVKNIDYPKDHYETIVVDNNSTDNSEEVIRSFPDVIYLKEAKKGASCARNKGIKHSKHDILAFIDADSIVSGDWLRVLLLPFEDEKTGAVGGEIRALAEGNIFSEYLSVSLFMRMHRYGKKRELKGYPTANLAVRKEIIAGEGFDPDLIRGQDKDLCYKILKKGYKIIFQPGAVVYHDNPRSLRSLIDYFVKGSLARVLLEKKHERSPDILILNYHIPGIFLLLLAASVISRNTIMFLLLLFPAAVFFIISGIRAYMSSKNFYLSFFIKPFLDALSILVTYFSYHYIRSGPGKRTEDKLS